MSRKSFFFGMVVAAVCCARLSAAPLLTEQFETYVRGELDVNDPSSPNAMTNNNPWAGPVPPNIMVVGAETTTNGILVTPHGGTNMVRGVAPEQFDQEYFNLCFWLNATNGNAPFFGNFDLDWWFFDPTGQGTNGSVPTQYQDFLALASYTDIPQNESFSPDMASFGAGFPAQRISIGGSSSISASGFNSGRYQTRDENQTGYDGVGWLNIPSAVRSVGWHHARVEVLPQRADQSVDVSIYVDNFLAPGVRFNTASSSGFNCIELNAYFSDSPAYWDDISFSLLLPPKLTGSLSSTNFILTWNNSFILQSTTNIQSGWTDVVDSNTNLVNSPFTASLKSKPAQFYRLRN